MFLRNVDICLRAPTAPKPRRGNLHSLENLESHVFLSNLTTACRICNGNRVVKNVRINQSLSEVTADGSKSDFYFVAMLLYLDSKNVLF
jgi:hypothetical protein